MRDQHLADIAKLFPELDPVAQAGEGAGFGEDLLDDAVRIAEALVFAAAEPLAEEDIAKRLPQGIAAADALDRLRMLYASRGVNLVRVAGKWMFRTAPDLAFLLSKSDGEPRRLSKAALETLAIIAYHQPVTRAEIEDIRGVAISKGTIDVLLETGWVRLRGRRRAPGRPVTYGTTEGFLVQFGLESVADLPGLEELKGAGLFDGRLPQEFGVPRPKDDFGLAPDEDPLDEAQCLDEAPSEEPPPVADGPSAPSAQQGGSSEAPGEAKGD